MQGQVKYTQALTTEVTTASFIPYSSHVTKHTIKLDSGDYLQVLRLQGAAHESADVQDINLWHNQLNFYMRNIASPHIALWTHVVRREYGEYPGGEFAPGFACDFNEKYRAHVASGRMLVNELYISVLYRPQPVKAVSLFSRFTTKNPKDLREQQLDALQALDDAVGKTRIALDHYDPEVLGCYDHNGVMFSEVQEFLAFLVNGEWRRQGLARAEIKDVLATSRPFFGKGGLMSFKGPARTQYAAVLAIHEYPTPTCPGLLNDLLSAPYEFVLAQSFTFISKEVAKHRLQEQHDKLVNAGDLAESQILDITQAQDDLVSNLFVMGAHSLALVIRANDTKALNENINDAGDALSNAGMKWAREDLGIASAFWSQLPGNFQYRVRIGDITSRNFAGFSSFHNFPMGRIRNNQWGDAVTMFRTTSGAPYYFNFHRADPSTRIDPNHKEAASVIVIGTPGLGKTVFAMFLLLQTQKFRTPKDKLTCLVFDRGLGASIAVRALGGQYYAIKNGVPTGWNPFQLDATPNNLSFLERLVRKLVRRDDAPLTPAQEKIITDAIAGVMEKDVPKSKRRLGAVLEFFSQNDAHGLHERLARWCRGGALGWLFDNAEDTLQVDGTPIVGFDVTDFLNNPETRTPTMMYLLHRVESLLDGRRIPIFMDEFGELLNDNEFEDFSRNKLNTIRKQNGFLVMFTQSPRQVLQSPISFAIVETTATQIYFPNPKADHDDYVVGLKVTEREYQIIRELPQKSRQVLIKHGHNSVVAELDLRGFEDELAVLSGNTETSALVENLVLELGTDPAVWLPEFHRRRRGAQA